jgi:hypothetical protein
MTLHDSAVVCWGYLFNRTQVMSGLMFMQKFDLS